MREHTDEIIWGEPSDGLWLARLGDMVTDFNLDPQRLHSAVPLIEEATADVKDRGNIVTNLKIEVERRHPSPFHARYFCFAHAKAAAELSQQTSRVLFARYKAGDVTTFKIPSAVLVAMPAKLIGATSIHNYSIVGQAIQ